MFSSVFIIIKEFSRVERIVFVGALAIVLVAAFFIAFEYLNNGTTLVAASGGTYVEGIVGQPTFLNPVLMTTSDADRSLVRLMFQNVGELAESIKTSEDGTVKTIRLKENIQWHDGVPITSDDVIFTIQTIQNPDSRSPLFAGWQGIVAERVSERELKISLQRPYVFFENVLQELFPIPKHSFETIPVANHLLSVYNFEPVGNGPFQYETFKKRRDGFITEYWLKKASTYNGEAYLDRIIVKFFKESDELVQAFNGGVIDGFGIATPQQIDRNKLAINYEEREFRMPRYYAVFFNRYAHPALNERAVRFALESVVEKETIIERVLDKEAALVEGPLLSFMKGYAPEVYRQEADAMATSSVLVASSTLTERGWEYGTSTVRSKIIDNARVPLRFRLVVPQIPFLEETAQMIKSAWEPLGVETEVATLPFGEMNEIIKTRNYEMILFGNIFGHNTDLFSFWHSSERFYPGLNLALFDDGTADALIEDVREGRDEEERKQDLAALQLLIVDDVPAIFLYAPNYYYITKARLDGIEEATLALPEDRFNNVANWHVRKARVFR